MVKVTLLKHTPDPERVVAAAARQCYSRFSAVDIIEEMKEEDIKRLIRMVVERGHHSVLEHAVFTFVIEDVSRACTHQLVRHRIASYSQQSHRYVKLREIEYIVPPSIKGREEAYKIFREALDHCTKVYEKLLEMGIPTEDARYILPHATPTKIVVTMNARELLHVFELRTCLKAQWEIRMVAEKMLELCKKVAPTVFENAGPPCVSKGICPEKDYKCPKWLELKEKGLVD